MKRTRLGLVALLACACPLLCPAPSGAGWTPAGHVFRVAGNGDPGFSGDGGPATEARLRSIQAIAVDGLGGLLIADKGNLRVRRVSSDGVITTVAGTGHAGTRGDGGPATRARLTPDAVAPLPAGGFLVLDSSARRVRRISPTGTISTAAGNGSDHDSGDGGPATEAGLSSPHDVAAMPDGGFLILDSGRLRHVRPDGTIFSIGGVYGEGTVAVQEGAPIARECSGFSVDAIAPAADGALARVRNWLCHVAADGTVTAMRDIAAADFFWSLMTPSGRGILVGSTGHSGIWRVPAEGPHERVFGARGTWHIESVEGVDASDARTADLTDLATDTSGALFVSETAAHDYSPPHSESVLEVPTPATRRLVGAVLADKTTARGRVASFVVAVSMPAHLRLTIQTASERVTRQIRFAGGRRRIDFPGAPRGVADVSFVAHAGHRTSTAHAALVLGGHLDSRSVATLLGLRTLRPPQPLALARAAGARPKFDQFITDFPDGCRRLSPRRIDCRWLEDDSVDVYCADIYAYTLAGNGLIRSRRYGCPGKNEPLFRRSPVWSSGYHPMDMRAVADRALAATRRR